VLSDLIVGSQGKKRGDEGICNAETGHVCDQFLGSILTVIGDDDRLHKHVQFQSAPARPGLSADVVNGCIEPFGLPAHLMALVVLQRPSEHGKADDVGMTGRMSKSMFPVDAHQHREMVLSGAKSSDALELVVDSVVCDRLAIEELANHFDGFGETSLSHRRWVEGQPYRGVLGEGVASSKSDLEASLAQMVNAG
jgi:hypothetical protein